MNRGETEEVRDLMGMTREGRLSAMPTLPLPAAILLGLYVCLCMAYLPMWRSQGFAGVILLVSAMMAALTLRSPWIIGMLTVPAFLLVSVSGSLITAALPIAFLCGTAYGAFLLLNVRSPLTAAVPVAALIAGVLTTGDVCGALLSLLCLPASLTLAYVLRRGMTRVRAICHLAAAMLIPMLTVGLVYVLLHGGTEVFEDLSLAVTRARYAFADCLAAWETGSGENAGRVVLEGMELALAGAIFNVLPGVLLALLAVLAYMANLLCLTLFRTYQRVGYLSRRVFVFAVSVPAATVFLVGYLALLLIGEQASHQVQFLETVAENLYLALLPAMICAGVLAAIRTFLLSSHRLMLLLGAAVLTVFSPAAALTVLSLIGACSVVWSAVRRRMRRAKPLD